MTYKTWKGFTLAQTHQRDFTFILYFSHITHCNHELEKILFTLRWKTIALWITQNALIYICKWLTLWIRLLLSSKHPDSENHWQDCRWYKQHFLNFFFSNLCLFMTVNWLVKCLVETVIGFYGSSSSLITVLRVYWKCCCSTLGSGKQILSERFQEMGFCVRVYDARGCAMWHKFHIVILKGISMMRDVYLGV